MQEGKVVPLTSHTLAPGTLRCGCCGHACAGPRNCGGSRDLVQGVRVQGVRVHALHHVHSELLPLRRSAAEHQQRRCPRPHSTERTPQLCSQLAAPCARLPHCVAVPLAIGGELPEGVQLREDMPEGGLGNVAGGWMCRAAAAAGEAAAVI